MPSPAKSKSRKDEAPVCNFCGESRDQVELLLKGKGAFICDACIRHGGKLVVARAASAGIENAFELIALHVSPISPNELVSSSRTFPLRVRADLQSAVDELLTDRATKTVGIHVPYRHEAIGISSLLSTGRNAIRVAPLQFEDVDTGDDVPKRCLKDALWVFHQDEIPVVAVLNSHHTFRGEDRLHIELAVPPGEAGQALVRHCFDAMEKAVNDARSYRGKVLSLEQSDPYSGLSSGLTVHKLPPVEAAHLILPEKTLRQLERNIVEFAQQRCELRQLGQATKKGLLFHGPPGTGKTHTVSYLSSRLPDHTTLIVAGDQVGVLGEYFTLARLLQPAILVIEDVDLIAQERTAMESPWQQVQLNKLLNEMDGLREDAEIFFVLTTNRPDTIETALAGRPGRIDQAIEFPLPDADCRARLVALYGSGLSVSAEVVERIIARSEGVSAAFVKELMRRAAQASLAARRKGTISAEEIDLAMEDLLFAGGRLNRSILGAAANEASGE
ncbi:MAG: AAA family ATPase [Kiloniellales bacterium]|nr:AAA family ATPase [Kiloniellales bacterium]